MPFDLNDDSTWINAKIYEAPSFNIAAYQSKVDEICGKANTGLSNVRVIWSPSPQGFKERYCKWDEGGNGTETHLRSKYCYHTYEDKIKDILLDVPIPRWVLEQHHHPAQIGDDETGRWETMYEGQQKIVREVRPRHPKTGYYTALPGKSIIAQHTAFCCAPLRKRKLICYGTYCDPNEMFLHMLRQAVEIREEEGSQRTDQPLSVATIEKAMRETAYQEQKKKELNEAQTSEVLDDNFCELLEAFTGESFADKRHFVNTLTHPQRKKGNRIITLN